MSLISNILDGYGISATLAQADDFAAWLTKRLWNEYTKERMNKRILSETQVRDLRLRLPNGTVNRPYDETLRIPKRLVKEVDLTEAKGAGLDLSLNLVETNESDDIVIRLDGKPQKFGDFKLLLRFKYPEWIDGDPISELALPLVINPDPKTLWTDIPTDPGVLYFKPDVASGCVAALDGERRILAASVRGRSHAKDGRPRDDHFKISTADNGWHIIAVADGAGSSKYSREGSRIACDEAVRFCEEKLKDPAVLDNSITQYNVGKQIGDKEEAEARKKVGDCLYSTLVHAAHTAHTAIKKVAENGEDTKLRDFSTTLMLAICKKFDFGWFIATWWVGDGAVALYDMGREVSLLGTPDEGEYSGQTRFLTMPEIFASGGDLVARLRFRLVNDFTALMLMTDGVSDPMFETDSNLKSRERWDSFWSALNDGFKDDEIGGVKLNGSEDEAKASLEQWLGFWSPGNHDDRTIAIMYKPQCAPCSASEGSETQCAPEQNAQV